PGSPVLGAARDRRVLAALRPPAPAQHLLAGRRHTGALDGLHRPRAGAIPRLRHAAHALSLAGRDPALREQPDVLPQPPVVITSTGAIFSRSAFTRLASPTTMIESWSGFTSDSAAFFRSSGVVAATDAR